LGCFRERRRRGRVARIDADGDGLVSQEVVRSLPHGKTGPNPHPPFVQELYTFVAPRYERSMASHDFTAADGNRDGQLSREEYRETSYAMERLLESPDGLALTFEGLDTNKDESLSSQEFTSAAGVDHFTRLDRNRDGQVDRGEYLHDETEHYRHHHEGTARDEIRRRAEEAFLELDINQDGVLTRVEQRGREAKSSHREQAADYEAMLGGDETRIDEATWW
jgi:hypothetical protein